MNPKKRFSFHKMFVIGPIVIGVGGLLFYLISPRLISNEFEMEMLEQKHEEVSESPDQSTVQNPKPPSEVDIEKAISVLENFDATERRNEEVESTGNKANPEAQVPDNSHQTPLSDEEERKQRRERIKNSPEYVELKAKITELALELTEWSRTGVELPAAAAYHVYMKNPYSVFGLTEAEADEIELSDEQIKFMREEGKRLQREAEAEYAQWKEVWDEILRQQGELSRQMGHLLKEK